MNEAAPFLKWAGGKRWLAALSDLPLPSSYERYIEPFLGGGALFFRLKPGKAILGDVNADLINTYKEVRDNLIRVQTKLADHHAHHSKTHYYETRSQEGLTGSDAAARFIYLNRTCWNGLYRVNKLGRFNVPIGTKSAVSFNDGELEAVSSVLQDADIECRDFEDTLLVASEGDFVFVDPPYTANHNMNGFLKYNETIFSWSDQERLLRSVAAAAQRGAHVMVTNADHSSVRDLYAGLGTYTQVWRSSVLAGKASTRGRTSEALFTINF